MGGFRSLHDDPSCAHGEAHARSARPAARDAPSVRDARQARDGIAPRDVHDARTSSRAAAHGDTLGGDIEALRGADSEALRGDVHNEVAHVHADSDALRDGVHGVAQARDVAGDGA